MSCHNEDCIAKDKANRDTVNAIRANLAMSVGMFVFGSVMSRMSDRLARANLERDAVGVVLLSVGASVVGIWHGFDVYDKLDAIYRRSS